MKKNSKNNCKHIIVLASILLIIISIAYINQKIKTDSIKSGYGICKGTVTGGKYVYRPAAYNLLYSYSVDNMVFNDNSHISIHKNYFKYFVGRDFPVIYSKGNPRKSQLLIFPRHFDAWNLDFPDTLEWVKQYQDVY